MKIELQNQNDKKYVPNKETSLSLPRNQKIQWDTSIADLFDNLFEGPLLSGFILTEHLIMKDQDNTQNQIIVFSTFIPTDPISKEVFVSEHCILVGLNKLHSIPP